MAMTLQQLWDAVQKLKHRADVVIECVELAQESEGGWPSQASAQMIIALYKTAIGKLDQLNEELQALELQTNLDLNSAQLVAHLEKLKGFLNQT
jgi:hypothetical protein